MNQTHEYLDCADDQKNYLYDYYIQLNLSRVNGNYIKKIELLDEAHVNTDEEYIDYFTRCASEYSSNVVGSDMQSNSQSQLSYFAYDEK